MTHKLTLEIPESIYRPLSNEALEKGQSIENLALQMIESTVQSRPDEAETEKLAELLLEEFEKRMPNGSSFSDRLFTRESFYEDRI